MRRKLLDIIHGHETHVCVPMQGSGTFSVEAAVNTLVPRDGHVLVLINGAYGTRLAKLTRMMGRRLSTFETPEDEQTTPQDVDRLLKADPSITHVGVIHCETSTGILNPLPEIAAVVARHGVEGPPGMGFVFARRSVLEKCAGNSTSLALDLHDQWTYMEKTTQWRYTPPTHVVVAFNTALDQLVAEGGQPARLARYTKNCQTLITGMGELGFRVFLKPEIQAPIILTFHAPPDPAYDFKRFYDSVRDKGFILYPGKLTAVETFRVGCIGAIGPDEMRHAVNAVRDALAELGIRQVSPTIATARAAA
jgi:2-aminoethylphosphonate-pyruvate transaminase